VERLEHRRRSSRRNLQKSDPSDAERAARTVLAVEASGVPKSGDGNVEMIRALRAARRSAIKART
jgi:transposase